MTRLLARVFHAVALALASDGIDIPLDAVPALSPVHPRVLRKLGVREARFRVAACAPLGLGDMARARALGCVQPTASPFADVPNLAHSSISHLIALNEYRAELRPSSGTLALLVRGQPLVFGRDERLGIGGVCTPVVSFREGGSDLAFIRCSRNSASNSYLRLESLVLVRVDANRAAVVDSAVAEFDSCFDDDDDDQGCRLRSTRLFSDGTRLRWEGVVESCDGRRRVNLTTGLAVNGKRAVEAFERDVRALCAMTAETGNSGNVGNER